MEFIGNAPAIALKNLRCLRGQPQRWWYLHTARSSSEHQNALGQRTRDCSCK
jgi:hypothetical protein